MRYKLAIFDMDGTILDTLEDLTDSINYALKANGYPEHTLEEVRSYVGNGLMKLVERSVPDKTNKEDIDKVFKQLVEYYQIHCADKTKPYDGIINLIKRLREAGCKTAVVSNKADAAVQELCKQYFPGLFDSAVGEKKDVLKKPAPDSVNYVLDYLHIDRNDAVYIGDSEVDIATASNAMVDCITVSWGFREIDFLKQAGAKTIVSEATKIYDIVIG